MGGLDVDSKGKASETAASGSSSHNPHTMEHGASAHHLQYGDIKVASYAPAPAPMGEDELQALPAERLAEIGCSPRDVRHHRRELLDAEARRIHAKRRYLFRKPRALQYFRGHTLVRGEDERSSQRIELFFDLTFVGIIAVLAEEAIHDGTGAGLVRYVITYFGAWTIWSYMREIFNAFYCDDLFQRTLVVWIMALLIIYGNNAIHAEIPMGEPYSGRAATIGSYLLATASIFFTALYYSFHVKAFRLQIRVQSAIWLCSCGLWIAAIFASTRAAIGLSVAALVLEYCTWVWVYSPPFKRLFKLRYSSAVNIEHEIERYADFFTLVMGEFLYSVVSGHPAGFGIHSSTGRAILCLMIAAAFQIMYMSSASSKSRTHPIRRNTPSAFVWFTIHIPIVSALTLCGDACAEFVKELEVSDGIRWMLCETYAIGMLGIWVLAMIEEERDAPGELFLHKSLRLLPRVGCALIATFLPLSSQEHLNTTQLLGILAGTASAAVLWEMFASLDGPNAPAEQAVEGLRTGDKSTPDHALKTPEWKGFPCLAEPGAFHVDASHQREQRRRGAGKDVAAEEEGQVSATGATALPAKDLSGDRTPSDDEDDE
ncbi:hypothetical protein OC834_001229 [Tilletia horrida]|nr:hypothetical protein OC834_001229 [Tilletia horrida]KAK0564624.1 hypothetical protein OC844_001615 [Tilletia horrida]